MYVVICKPQTFDLLCVCSSAAAVSDSYKTNSKQEKLLLSYADSFQRQFRQLYGDRKALFLKPVNEHGIEVNAHDCTCRSKPLCLLPICLVPICTLSTIRISVPLFLLSKHNCM